MDTLCHILACDIGNSYLRIAHVHGDKVADVRKFQIGRLDELGKGVSELWNEMPTPKKIVAGSVNPRGLKALEAAVCESIKQPVIVIGRDLPLPIQTDLPNPQGTGIDRLCCAAAAFDTLGVACVIADFGTAITIDCVNNDGVFVGGAILPGLTMGAKSLHENTAQLPQVELSEPTGVFGKNTQDAIVGGLVFGARGALRELVESYANALGHWPLVILTGGDASLICPHPGESELVQAIVPELALRGIAIAYYRTLVGPEENQ